MASRFILLSFVFLFSLTTSLHATVTVLVEEVDNGDGGTDVIATATGTMDVSPFISRTRLPSRIELDSGKFMVGPSGSSVDVEGAGVSFDSIPLWTGEERDLEDATASEYKGPLDASFSNNTAYSIGVSSASSIQKVYISDQLYNDLAGGPGDIGTIRSTWADKSFSDLAIVYNSTWTLEWDGGGEGKTLTYNAIPEPSQYGVLFGLAAAAAAVGLRRRRRAGGAS